MFKKQIVIIDNGGSMKPFEYRVDTYVAEIYPDADIYYMYNTVGEYLYTNKSHTSYRKTADVRNELSRHHPKSVLVVFISDAGAANKSNVEKRFRATLRDCLAFNYKTHEENYEQSTQYYERLPRE